MVFSSVLFLFYYLPITLGIYYIVPLRFRNLVLLVANLIFYGWGEPIYIGIMFLSIFIDYFNGYFVSKYIDTNRKKAKGFVILSIILNLSLLGFFKYFDFFATSINQLLGTTMIQPMNLPLPLGISFYTFQTMSYTIDLYRKEAKAQKNMVDFGTYVTLFPQLIAGPIVRYHDVSKQLTKRSHSFSQFSLGIQHFCVGLGKKVLLANAIGLLWETIRATSFHTLTFVGSWLGILAFGFQIYFDFSGYSDMAIGLGKMFGFTFLENFNYPYIAKSITDFWRRWHISLSTWFKEYVYIPLGGNKHHPLRNLLIVWFLTGLWHGASWNFIVWGMYFGILLILEKKVLLPYLNKAPSWLCHLYTLIIVGVSWVLFALESPIDIISYLQAMVGAHGFINASDLYLMANYGLLIIILIVAATPLGKTFYEKYLKAPKYQWLIIIGCELLLLGCTFYIVDASYNPFLYFRF